MKKKKKIERREPAEGTMFSRAPPFLHLTCSLNGPPPFLTKCLLETKQVSRQHLPLTRHLNSKKYTVSSVVIYESSRPLLVKKWASTKSWSPLESFSSK
jgi:hypothetical protein